MNFTPVGIQRCDGCQRIRPVAAPTASPFLKLCLMCRRRWTKPDVRDMAAVWQ